LKVENSDALNDGVFYEKDTTHRQQILSIFKQKEMGKSVPDLCRAHGMSSACFYRLRSKYGKMDAPLMTQMKEFPEKNSRLKKMCAEERLMGVIAREALEKKL